MLEIHEHVLAPPAGTGCIRELRLNRPPVNGLNPALVDSLIDELASLDQEVRAVIVSGQHGVFSAGLDVPALLKLDHRGIAKYFGSLWRLQALLATCRVPLLYAITGHCPAGGTVLALYGDYRVMAQAVAGEQPYRIGLNEVQVGLTPGPLIQAAFARIVGAHAAAQLLTRGALVDSAQALRLGLVDELAPPLLVVERTVEVAREITRAPLQAMRRARDCARQDLVLLFGPPQEAAARAAKFADDAAQVWWSEEAQATLQHLFAKRGSDSRSCR
ncbi:MAG: enoyl-CoA hydratase/isomerase family protein [Pseudomonadales bacterium]|jgi:enoyl-CoA hydratase/carnithine racemase|nr:enoyl-CoA hydratase/isomerase family protein [Pseudomonadales bacterium]